MKQIKLYLFAPLVNSDITSLLLRTGVCALLFYRHGAEKLFDYQHMLTVFTDVHPMGNFDPLGIGKENSLRYALFSDAVCSVLVLSGLFTRPAALLILINILVSHFLVFDGSINDHGELSLLYLISIFVVLLSGPGKLSVDHYIFDRDQN